MLQLNCIHLLGRVVSDISLEKLFPPSVVSFSNVTLKNEAAQNAASGPLTLISSSYPFVYSPTHDILVEQRNKWS